MVYGKGIYNKGKCSAYKNGRKTKAYSTWQGMLQRCYDNKLHKRYPTYIGCTICDEWLNFQIFAEWFDKNYKEGCQLDKDLINLGNKIYSPETCQFVSNKINNLFHINKKRNKSGYKTGVSIQNGRFRAQCCGLSRRHIGYFNTEEEAHLAYLQAKHKHINEVV